MKYILKLEDMGTQLGVALDAMEIAHEALMEEIEGLRACGRPELYHAAKRLRKFDNANTLVRMELRRIQKETERVFDEALEAKRENDDGQEEEKRGKLLYLQK